MTSLQHPSHALVLVDLQPDFMPGGALAVRGGDEVVAVANALMPSFATVVATQDWHPAEHGSFASQHPGRAPGEQIDLHGLQQVLWPDHCIQGSPGAALAADLDTSRITHVVQKGMDPEVDSYSGFYDNGRRHKTGLHAWLKERKILALTVMGLATDYCVKYTALDARRLGFDVTLHAAGCRGVELSDGDVERALEEMQAAGVRVKAA